MFGQALVEILSKPLYRILIAVQFCVLFLCVNIAFADHLQHYADLQNQDLIETYETVPEIKLPGVGKVNQAHSYLSSSVERLAQRIDTFFGEDRVYEEATGTYIQTRTSLVIDQDGGLDYDLKFRAKLRLPQLKEKFRLVIESEDEDRGLDDFNQDTRRNTIKGELENTDVAASLQYMFQQTKSWNISLRPGLKLSDPIETFLRLRMAGTLRMTEKWLMRGITQFGYYSEEGWGSDWRLDVERRTGSQDFFRASSNVWWRENSPGNQFLSQTFLLTHILSPRTSVAFEVGVTGETRPKLEDSSYFSSVRYRRDIHRGWVFLELKPRVEFARENDFDEELSLFVTLELLLGEDYSH
jgi:hypothetical protein